MKVCEFKKCVKQLKNIMELEKDADAVLSLVLQLTEILNGFDDEHNLQPEMMVPIKRIMNEFWHWVINYLPYDSWQNNSKVFLWLRLQRSLESAALLDVNFHHPILYLALQNRYDSVSGNQLKIAELMPLLICASRRIGYADKEPPEAYPFLQLSEKINARRPQEVEKLNDILFLLRTIFYLIYRYCTVEQLALLPLLIYFRTLTTDEERRSELAIFNLLVKKPLDCLKFFDVNQDFINTRTIKAIAHLQNISHLFPTGRLEFLRVTNGSRWIYHFMYKSRVHPTENENDLINETLHLLNADFATQKNISYHAGLDFAAKVNKQMPTLSNREAQIVHKAVYLFCLEKYIQQRKEDPRPKHSLFSLSGETKCHAAEKKQLVLRGESIQLSFWEMMATMQGRLNDLIGPMENPVASALIP